MSSLLKAIAVKFGSVRYIPTEDFNAVKVGVLNPNGTTYQEIFGIPMDGPGSAKGWPPDPKDGQMQHGQSTDWLMPLFAHPNFLSGNPEYSGVVVTEPLNSMDSAVLNFAWDAKLGGAYGYLYAKAVTLGLAGPNAGAGPKRTPAQETAVKDFHAKIAGVPWSPQVIGDAIVTLVTAMTAGSPNTSGTSTAALGTPGNPVQPNVHPSVNRAVGN